MKHRISIFSLLTVTFLLAASLLPACQKAPINGDLDGMWQVMEIETNGEVMNVKDEQLYYHFYLHVTALSFYGFEFAQGNFHYEGGEIMLDFPYLTTDADYEKLTRFGIYSNPVEFHVTYLDKNKLIMENEKAVITLRKF